MFKFSNKSKENMKGLKENLVNFFNDLIKISKYDFMITCGIRSFEEQNKLYQQGRTTPGNIVTNCDGEKYKSKHQIKKDGYGHAGDIAILINNKVSWKEQSFVEFVNDDVRALMEKHNIEWGGDWNFKDYPHFQDRG